jgi:hypothetical protein
MTILKQALQTSTSGTRIVPAERDEADFVEESEDLE